MLRIIGAINIAMALLFSAIAPINSPGQTVPDARVGVDPTRPAVMTLFDAVRTALENNLEIDVERTNVRQAEYDLFAARGARDIGLSGGSFFENRTVPVGSVLAGGPGGTLTTRSFSYDFTAQQLLPTGGQWVAQVTNSRIDSNSQFASLNPQFNTAASFQLRQPLVRNLSIDEARRRIRIAARRLDLSDSQFRQRAIEIVARVQRAYWDLVFALKDLRIRNEAIDLAKSQLERNKRMVDDGAAAPIELVSVEVELDRRIENALSATEAVTRSENALKQLILGDRASPLWQQPITPSDSPDLSASPFTLTEAMSVALANRPEVAQNTLQQAMNKIDVDFFKNQTRPQIDLVAGYTSTGLSGARVNTVNPFAATNVLLLERVNILSGLADLPPIVGGDAGQLPDFLFGSQGKSFGNLFGNDFRTVRFGISFGFPLRNRTAEAQLGRAVAETRKTTSQRKALEQNIEVEVRNAIQSVETTRKRIETSRGSREAAEKQLESEQRRFEAGLSTTFFVLERQNALSEAQGRELRALTDYNKAVSELQRVMGTTLVAANVEVNSK